MPNAYGATPFIYRPVMSQLSFADVDPLYLSERNLAFPPMEVNAETATYFKHDLQAAYEQKENKSTKFSTPESHNTSDESATFSIQAISDAFEFSNADLSQALQLYHMSRQQMVEAQRFFTTMRQKKAKDLAFDAFVQENTNYESASQYFNAGVAWSNVGLSDPLADIEAAKIIQPRIDSMIINNTILSFLRQNQTIQARTTITSESLGSRVDPSINVEYLKNYFGLNNIHLINGEVETNSADPADTSLVDIWTPSAFLYQSTQPSQNNLMQGAFMKHIFWRPENIGEPGEGWAWIEKMKEGGVAGVTKWELWNHYSYHSHDPRLAVRIDAVVV